VSWIDLFGSGSFGLGVAMPDLTAVSAVLGSIKTATDIARFLRESDFSLERAELKHKVADLVGALADAKLELVDVQETIAAKDKRIVELEDAFQSKGNLVRRYDAYYDSDDSGAPFGVAFCLRCWETEHKKRQLVRDAKVGRIRVCTNCGHQYESRLASEIVKSDDDSTDESA